MIKIGTNQFWWAPRLLSHLPDGFDKEKLKNILIDYYGRIRDKNVSESTNCMTTPVTSKLQRVLHAYRSKIFKQLDKLLEKAIIEHSDIPYSSPIIPVKKRRRHYSFML